MAAGSTNIASLVGPGNQGVKEIEMELSNPGLEGYLLKTQYQIGEGRRLIVEGLGLGTVPTGVITVDQERVFVAETVAAHYRKLMEGYWRALQTDPKIASARKILAGFHRALSPATVFTGSIAMLDPELVWVKILASTGRVRVPDPSTGQARTLRTVRNHSKSPDYTPLGWGDLKKADIPPSTAVGREIQYLAFPQMADPTGGLKFDYYVL